MDFFVSHLTFFNVFDDLPFSHLLSDWASKRYLKPVMKKYLKSDEVNNQNRAWNFYTKIVDACFFRSDLEPLGQFFFYRPFRLEAKKWIKQNYMYMITMKKFGMLDFAHRFFKVNDFATCNHELMRYAAENFRNILVEFPESVLIELRRQVVFKHVNYDKIEFDFYLANHKKFITVFGEDSFPPVSRLPDTADEKIIMHANLSETEIINLLKKCKITDFIQIIKTAKLHQKRAVVDHFANIVAAKIQRDALNYKEEIDARIAELKSVM